MRRCLGPALVVLFGCGLAGEQASPEPEQPKQSTASVPRPQPKPGERVRQPELDGYCGETERPEAFYYHGGRPVVRLAHQDGCAPLYLTECEPPSACASPREQEPGMWCCAAPAPAAQARR